MHARMLACLLAYVHACVRVEACCCLRRVRACSRFVFAFALVEFLTVDSPCHSFRFRWLALPLHPPLAIGYRSLHRTTYVRTRTHAHTLGSTRSRTHARRLPGWQVREQCAWKYANPCNAESFAKQGGKAGPMQDYDKVVKYNYQPNEVRTYARAHVRTCAGRHAGRHARSQARTHQGPLRAEVRRENS